MLVEWQYSDNTMGSIDFSADQLNGWQEHDILPSIEPGKLFVSLRVWGYSGPGMDISYFDDSAADVFREAHAPRLRRPHRALSRVARAVAARPAGWSGGPPPPQART